MPGIHRLMVAGILMIAAGGVSVTQYLSHGIEKNIVHNEAVLKRYESTEAEALQISDHLLPAFQALHSLDVTVNRHVSEFELHVLDADRDRVLLVGSLSDLESSLERFPAGFQNIKTIDRERLEEIVGVFVDITYEALEIRSPNKQLQLISDSEDVFTEFRVQLDDIRKKLDTTVSQRGEEIVRDLQNARASVSQQQKMLDRLQKLFNWGLSLLILFILLITIMLFRSLHHRLDKVAGYAHAIADGKYAAAIDFESPDKIGDMAESVSHMGSSMAELVAELRVKAAKEERSALAARKLAYFDSLTGLPNRQNFIEKLEAAIDKSRHTKEKIAVAYLDLDGFKKVNDSYGHSTGDQLLCAVADRLSHSVRDDDAIARSADEPPALMPSRLGGDEFTFLINRIHDRDGAERIARRILSTLAKPYQLADREVTITPSMGVAVYPDDGTTVSLLLKNSDMAMYQAKESGRNTIRLFNADIGERQVNRISLERDLAKALERDELSIHYQPKIDLSSRRLIGGEALLRWQHPCRGMVSPADFIPLAEESGMIVPIGGWVLQQVCGQLAQWRAENLHPVPIAINVSAKQFLQGDLLSIVSDCIRVAGIHADQIELELTESILMYDTKLAVDILSKLKGIGVKTSLDDFGTGYSSLSYLKLFPLSTLKIDHSFVRDIETDADDAAIVKAILALSESLGLRVIAEGVESESQADFLSKHGCQEAQGYLFGRPVPVEAFTGILRCGSHLSDICETESKELTFQAR
ncbi:MAG: EAL domain-containing protein [Gammaproteobacteria bacterium]|nr:EAL domain-containing protein [Gammaproteobacteria bacterium]